MNTVSNLFINIVKFKTLNDVTNTAYVDQTISTNKITAWVAVLQDYKIGQTKDVDPNLATDANAMIAISKLNQYTLRTAANANDPIPRCSTDVWVYDLNDCTANQSQYVVPVT